jgi:hypothetical protein
VSKPKSQAVFVSRKKLLNKYPKTPKKGRPKIQKVKP